MRFYNWAGLVLGIAFLACSPLRADDLPRAKPAVDPERWLREAEVAEKAGKFEAALDGYLKVYISGRTDSEIRERIRQCFRNASRLERHRDPAFQQFVLGLQAGDALNLYSEVLEKIHKLYPDAAKATYERLFSSGLDELDRALTEPEFRRDYLPPEATDKKINDFRASIRENLKNKLPTTQKDSLAMSRAILAAATKQLGLKNGSAAVLELLCGASGGLDEFSTYLSPGHETNTPLYELAAYGVFGRFDAMRGLVIDSIAPGSWAEVHTKLIKGNRIVRLNGKPMADATTERLAEALRAVGTMGHDLEIAADEESNPDSIKLPVPLPTVYAIDMPNTKDGVGYFRLGAFQESTPQEIDDAILELRNRGMKTLVIDIRGNSGGLFAAAVAAAKRFLPSGAVARTDGRTPDFANRIFGSDSGIKAHDFPIVLLVDTKTMSAAEVLAAALKDNGRATLVGLPTFGKGLIQAPISLKSIDSGDTGKSGILILSIATTSSPNGQPLNGRGVTPHVSEPNPDRQLVLALEKAAELLKATPSMMR